MGVANIQVTQEAVGVHVFDIVQNGEITGKIKQINSTEEVLEFNGTDYVMVYSFGGIGSEDTAEVVDNSGNVRCMIRAEHAGLFSRTQRWLVWVEDAEYRIISRSNSDTYNIVDTYGDIACAVSKKTAIGIDTYELKCLSSDEIKLLSMFCIMCIDISEYA